jgi:hypothetical protein
MGKSEFKIDLGFEEIEKEIESFFKKGVPVDVRKLNDRIKEINSYILSLKDEPKDLEIPTTEEKNVENIGYYKVTYKGNKESIIIHPNLVESMLDSYMRGNLNTRNDLLIGYDEDSMEYILLNASDVLSITLIKD